MVQTSVLYHKNLVAYYIQTMVCYSFLFDSQYYVMFYKVFYVKTDYVISSSILSYFITFYHDI